MDGIASGAATCYINIPYGGQFKSQLFHFLMIFPANMPGKVAENVTSSWASVPIWKTQRPLSPGFCLAHPSLLLALPNPVLGPGSPLGNEPADAESFSISPSTPVTVFQIKETILFKKNKL